MEPSAEIDHIDLKISHDTLGRARCLVINLSGGGVSWEWRKERSSEGNVRKGG